MNKEQKIQELTERIEKFQTEIDELKKELEELKDKPYEISYPEPKSKVYYIDSYTGEIHCILLNAIDKEVKHLYELGLYFDTKEEAEQFKREQTLIKKIKCWAKEQQGDWKPDWNNDDEEKYYITYFKDKSLGVSWEITWGMINFTKLPYFKTSEITQECIKLFGNEIKEALANG